MKRMGWDDQMRDLKTFGQVHVEDCLERTDAAAAAAAGKLKVDKGKPG